MSVVAELKAVLKMDTSNFKAGAVEAQGSLNGLTQQLNASGKEMVSFASVASGAGQVVRGNFSGAVFALLTKLKGIPPVAGAVVVGMTAIAAAAYQVGKAFGVNTTPIDNFIKALQGKLQGAPNEGPGPSVNTQALLRQMDEARQVNEGIRAIKANQIQAAREIEFLDNEIGRLEKELAGQIEKRRSYFQNFGNA